MPPSRLAEDVKDFLELFHRALTTGKVSGECTGT